MNKNQTIHEENYYYEIVRKNIRRYRKFREITQDELAELVDVSKDYIAQIESPKLRKHCTIGTAGKIADALEIDIRDLFEKID